MSTTPATRSSWPVEAPLTGTVQLREDQAVVYVPGPGGQMVAVLREHLPTAPVVHQPRDLTPAPLIDPRAQRIAAGGVLAAGVGYGGGQLLVGAGQVVSALAGLGSVVMWVAIAVVAARLAPGLGGGRGPVHHHTTVTTRWWGRSTIHTR
uniref:Uncharacterized protein n=2 Tax=Streptomyces TaxID=1883 RepID=D2KKW2_9ACTN|nr:hypothetical protein [Streptomyces sp. Y27]ADA71999.1 hypothetical protein pWTY27_7 [Streptomyces sp. Y27]